MTTSRRALCCLLFLATAVAADEVVLPPLQEIPYDSLTLKNDDTLVGTIVDYREDDGYIIFQKSGTESRIGYAKGRYTSYSYRRLAPDIIEQRLAILIREEDILNRAKKIEDTLRWGLEKGQDKLVYSKAIEAAKAVADDTRVAEKVIRLWTQTGRDLGELEGMSRAVLEANQTWVYGREKLLEILLAEGRDEEIDAEVEKFLELHPLNRYANSIEARRAEQRGDIKAAQAAYYNSVGRDAGDGVARLGYARCSLYLREFDRAGAEAATVLEEDESSAEAAAILGSVALQKGRDEQALALLETSAEEISKPRLREIAVYNYGLALLRTGRREEAAEVWQKQSSPQAELGVAIAKDVPVDRAAFEHDLLVGVAVEHNLCVALEAGATDVDELRQQLSYGSVARHTFLDQAAAIVTSEGSTRAVRAIERRESAEARRWVLWGHLRGGRLDEAAEVLADLPDDDGYAAICRVYLAAARDDEAGARKFYKELVEPLAARQDLAVPPPADYVSVLAANFMASEGGYRRYDFALPDGEILGPGWSSRARGTGVRIHIEDGALVFDGTPTASRTPVNRAWCTVYSSRFEEVVLHCDASSRDGAAVGIELLDERNAHGLALGIMPDGELRWRTIEKGRAGKWKPFSPPLEYRPERPLRLRYLSGGRVAVPDPADPRNPLQLGEPLDFTGKLHLAIFAEGEVGEPFRFSIDYLDVR